LLKTFVDPGAPRALGWDVAWDNDLDWEDVTVFVDPLDGTKEFTEVAN
jgi:3'-phosphoadenosine 5'-phosphosulfate (PAPS) 3'-phosphatase